jgi:peroxiredoxin
LKPAQALQIVFVVVAAFAVYWFVRTAKDGERRRACTPLCALRPHYAAQNRLAPDFELPSIDGKQVRLSEHRGKVVILNFWTKTCTPCLEEMPSLGQLARMIERRRDIVLLTVSTDETPADVRDTLRSVLGGDAPFVTLIDPEARVVTERYGTKLFPETWFVDPDGVIRARFDGARDWANALTIDFAETLARPLGCRIEFQRGSPGGALAGLCEEMAPSG